MSVTTQLRLEAQPTMVIAEVAQAHDGSLGTAHAYVDAVADAGAGAVKFQTHIAVAESTPSEQWRVKFSPQDETRHDYWRRMEFTEKQWAGLRYHAEQRGLLFLSSPFSTEAFELLCRVGVAAWKVASGEVGNTELISRMAETRLPLLISTGMSSWTEIEKAVTIVQDQGTQLAVMQCTSAYPCPPEDVGLNQLAELRSRFQCSVGLSDHSGTIFPSLAAATLGADVVEVHVTMSRRAFGPDVASSITCEELIELTRGVEFISQMLAHPTEKDIQAQRLEPMRSLFTRSLVARVDLEAGHVLQADDLAVKKPGTGLPSSEISRILNRRLKCAVPADTLIDETFLEDE